jgi:hypothetical protein
MAVPASAAGLNSLTSNFQSLTKPALLRATDGRIGSVGLHGLSRQE